MRLIHPNRLLVASLTLVGLAFTGPASAGGLAGVRVRDDTESGVITFTASDFYDNEEANVNASVYADTNANNAGTAGKYFGFTVSGSDVTVQNVYLRDYDNDNDIIGSSNATDNGQNSSSKKRVTSVPMTLTVTSDSTTTQTGTVTLTETGNIFDLGHNGHALFFEISWTQGSTTGSSYSRTFAFVHSSQVSAALSSFTNTNPVYPENPTGTNIASQTAIITVIGTTTSSASPSAASDTSSGSLTSSTSTASGSSSHKNGVSGGTIAGIVVGVIAGVLIGVGALIWFFFVRRRRQRGAYTSNVRGTSAEPFRSSEYMSNLGRGAGAGAGAGAAAAGVAAGAGVGIAAGEKEANVDIGAGGVASETASPDSPYMDDEGGTRGAGGNVTSGAAAPVLGAPVPTPGTRAVDSALVLPQSTSAVSGQAPSSAHNSGVPGAAVAALIEEHMTAEDVARLEAEERELDAAIANAMRNRTTGTT